jgi:hypothetical protein
LIRSGQHPTESVNFSSTLNSNCRKYLKQIKNHCRPTSRYGGLDRIPANIPADEWVSEQKVFSN